MIIELAAYNVKNGETYGAIQEGLHRLVSNWQGYVGSMWLRSNSEPTKFADIAVWVNLEDAQSAAAKFDHSDDPIAVAAKQHIGDLTLFGHFAVTSNNNVLTTFAEDGNLVEIAAGFPKDVATYETAQKMVHDVLKSEYRGVKAGDILKGDVDEKGTCLVDLISWETAEDMQNAFETVSTDKRFEAFFAASGEPILCELYTVAGVRGQGVEEAAA